MSNYHMLCWIEAANDPLLTKENLNMQTARESIIERIGWKIYQYIPVIVLLGMFMCVAYSIIALLIAIFIPPLDVSFTRDENPSMPCGIEDRYVVVTNNSSSPINLEGWRVTHSGEPYTFPNHWLQPSESIKLWRGSGTDDTDNLYAGHSRDAWRFDYGLTVESKNRFGVLRLHSFIGVNCDPLW
jgi:hypothetical protein